MTVDAPKPVEWIGSSRADLKALPEDVRDAMGHALYQAQVGSDTGMSSRCAVWAAMSWR